MLIHHAIGADVAPPLFPQIGAWDGSWTADGIIEVVREHPVTAGLAVGDTLRDTCWDSLGIQSGDDGVVLAKITKDRGLSVASLVVGEVGKGKVVLCGMGIGAGFKRESSGGKQTMVKVEQAPQGRLKQLLLGAVAWLKQ